MKNTILIIALLFGTVFTSFSQSPIVKDFRKIIADAPSQFNNLQADLFQENGGNKFYHSTMEKSPIASAYIQVPPNQELPMYIIDYNVSKMSSQMIGMFTLMVNQYLDELNEMVKSGQYQGTDYTTADGRSVTELKNMNNDLVVQYVSDATYHNLYFFALPK